MLSDAIAPEENEGERLRSAEFLRLIRSRRRRIVVAGFFYRDFVRWRFAALGLSPLRCFLTPLEFLLLFALLGPGAVATLLAVVWFERHRSSRLAVEAPGARDGAMLTVSKPGPHVSGVAGSGCASLPQYWPSCL